jgi:hypothetical protein
VLTGVAWDESLANARAECAAGATEARLEHAPDDWFFIVPCESVR